MGLVRPEYAADARVSSGDQARRTGICVRIFSGRSSQHDAGELYVDHCEPWTLRHAPGTRDHRIRQLLPAMKPFDLFLDFLKRQKYWAAIEPFVIVAVGWGSAQLLVYQWLGASSSFKPSIDLFLKSY